MLVTKYNTSVINSWSPSLAESVPFCPCPPETSFEVVEGISFFELSQIDSPVLYSCQCDEVW